MKILYIIPGSDYGEPEQKIYHLISKLKEVPGIHIAVGFLYDNHLKNLVQSLNIQFTVFGGYPGLVRFFQTHHVDIVHFYSSKRLLQVLNQHTPHYTRIVETVFNDGIRGDSTTLGDRTRIDYTIFDSLSLTQASWPAIKGSTYQPYGLNLSLLKKEDRNLLRSKYNVPSNIKTIGVIAKPFEELNINSILQLALAFKRLKNPLKIILFYSGSAKAVLQNKIVTLGLESYLCVDSLGPSSLSFLDMYLDLSNGQEIRASTLEALCYRVPVIIKDSPDHRALMAPKKVGFLYNDEPDLIQKYCIAAAGLDRQQISLPASYHVDATVAKIVELYKATSDNITEAKQVFDDKTYYIVPYSIYGGAEVYLKNHIKQGTFYNVHLLFLAPNTLYNELKDTVECTILPNLTELGNYLLAKQVRKVCFYNSANVYRLLARVKKLSPLHITEIVHSYHSWPDSMHNTDRPLVDEVIAVAGTVAKQWNINKFKIVPPVIDEARFKLPRVQRERPTIGTVARFSPEKNLKRVLDIAALMASDYQFIIIGKDGGSRKELEDYIKQKNLSSRILLKDYSNEVEREYASFDLFLLTSTVEGTPLTILEALAAGLPVVAPNVGAIKEMLKGQTSYVFDPNESDHHIAHRIKKLVQARRTGSVQFTTPQQKSTPPPAPKHLPEAPIHVFYSDENNVVVEPMQPIQLKSKPLAVRYR